VQGNLPPISKIDQLKTETNISGAEAFDAAAKRFKLICMNKERLIDVLKAKIEPRDGQSQKKIKSAIKSQKGSY